MANESRITSSMKAATNRKRNVTVVYVVAICLLFCVAFCLGFFVRGSSTLLEAVGLTSLETDTETNPGMTVSGDTADSLAARVAEIEGYINQESADSFDLDSATAAVLNALFETSDDAFLHYYDEQSYQAYLASTADPSAGVGVLFGESEEGCYAADVFESSYAEAAGVQTGDYVESIDGVSKDAWTSPDVLDALQRSDGETVYITWRREASSSDEEDEVFGTTLTFSSETQDNITCELDEETGVAFIDIKQIASDSATVLSETISEATEDGAQAFVLDLRDVPGGYLTQAVDIASLFITSGTVVQIETPDGITTRSVSGETITSAPLVVLVNKNTSGCAEVLAAALQETDTAEIVGEQTQGKGSVQIMQALSFGGALRYTAAYYLTPNGDQIDGAGVYPDYEVSSTTSQKTMALDVAESQIS